MFVRETVCVFVLARFTKTRLTWWLSGMMPAMTQQAQMRQARPGIAQQQVRPSAMSARPITGQQPLAVPQQRAAGGQIHFVVS